MKKHGEMLCFSIVRDWGISPCRIGAAGGLCVRLMQMGSHRYHFPKDVNLSFWFLCWGSLFPSGIPGLQSLHLGLPPSPQEPQFWKHLMEKTSPIDLTQLPHESSERGNQTTKRLCGVF
jgi:hypothetical protein